MEDAEAYMMRREWSGKNFCFPLRVHIAKHREAFNEMVRAAQFIPYEVPNEHTRVGRLIKSIQSKDPSIVSAITHIQGNALQRDDFELAADFLLLTAPKLKDPGSGNRKNRCLISRGDVKEVAPRKFIVSSVVSCTADPFLLAYDLESKVSTSPFSQFHVKSVKSIDGKDSLMDPFDGITVVA